MNWASIVAAFLMHGPEVFADGEQLFNTIAHGAGGVQKVENAVASLNTLLGHATAALASVQPPAPPPPPAH